MQKEFTENFNKLYQCFSRPMMDLVELNTNTLNNWAHLNPTEEWAQTKKPEDFIALQTKLASVAGTEFAKYTQQAMEIGFSAMTDAGKIWADVMHQTTTKAANIAKTGPMKANRE